MAFDKPTRNRLSSFVAEARRLVAEEFTQQFQSLYGISDKGTITPLEQLTHLDDVGLATAALLRERIDYFIKTHPEDREGSMAPVARLAREQAFTILNRLAAIRMAEKRGLIVESVGKGYQSKGFKVFEQVAGSGLGDTYHRYRRYIFCLFDELAVDLGVLFDRRSPQGLLFPRETALLALLAILNASDLDDLWAEDETIGWIYQYYNDPAERKKMRDESAAPRNSRELAVRNQFFTPRYVVEFLTDNTLGRTWYEMMKGKTRLADQCRYLVRRPTEIFLEPNETFPETPPREELSQEELLKQPVHIPHRPLKDPREIGLLDPACGSMHFGLYAFDLFETIYEEAWDLGLEVLGRDYPEKDAFLRDVPRLIIEQNIHGIDIDPRAVQIAGLSLWLRAQKSWQSQHVPAAERPRIMRSNVVCAEPMPGSPEMLKEFTATLHPPLLGQMVEKVFAQMQLAGEAGSLLKIEEQITSLVKEAKKLWQTRPKTEQMELSLGLEVKQKQGELPLDVSGISDERFWDTAEERIYTALHAYSEQAEAGSYQRRLFAEDAARGFAFIDLCRKRYDVVVMNPPFGSPPIDTNVQKLIASSYPKYKKNLACSFVFLAKRFSQQGSRIGVICDRSLFFRKTYKPLRLDLLSGNELLFADLGWEVMDDANVEAAEFVTSVAESSPGASASFFDLRHSETREMELIRLISTKPRTLSFDGLRSFPNAAFAHWVVPSLIRVFNKFPPSTPEHFQASNGMSACDSPRFLRLWWEIPPEESSWVPLAHGGKYSPFVRPLYFSANWKNNGAEIKQYIVQRYPYLNGDPGWVLKNEALFFLPGLTYGKRAMVLSSQTMPKGAIFSDEGQSVFPSDGTQSTLVLGFLNSRLIRYLINSYCGQHKHSGYLNLLPWIGMPQHLADRMSQNAEDGIRLRLGWERLLDQGSRYFVPLAPVDKSLKGQIRGIIARRCEDEIEFLDAWLEVQTILEKHAGLSVGDANEFIAACGGNPTAREFPGSVSSEESHISHDIEEDIEGNPESDEESVEISGISLPSTHYSPIVGIANAIGVTTRNLFEAVTNGNGDSLLLPDEVSKLFDEHLGYNFGRWDIRFATGGRRPPELPDPFAPLPVCPPGMLQNPDGLTAEPKDVPADYPLRISWPGIFVDDNNHPEDIVTRVREALEVVWKDRAEAVEHEASELLGVKTLRDYFRRPAGFFADHLKRYSKSRRQAPIYWPLSTAKGSYTLWIYYHRLTDQTLHTALADFIDPKLKAVRAEISTLRESADHRTRLEELLDLEKELADFRAEIENVIKLPWKPNLNDGVLITASPLWKLFRLPKWQKDLKACWDKLEKGEYDWAHLAYSIWPKRVEEACKKDRSIAIAHNLEHLCQTQPSKSKKKRGKKGNENES